MSAAEQTRSTSRRIRRADERGHANHGWLDSRHTFSFANYYDPEHMGFGHLRVINEDRVAAGRGFGSHPHRDMEIVSVVLDGALAHKDSMGSGSTLRPGEVQVMSAGTGVVHSEFNASDTEPVHFLQIWIEPAQRRTAPRYDEKAFPWAERTNRFQPIVSGDGRDESLRIGQDAVIYSSVLEAGVDVDQEIPEGRQAWVHVVTGAVEVDGIVLHAGDALASSSPGVISLVGVEDAHVLLFDLARLESA